MVFISNGKTTCFTLYQPSSGFHNFLAKEFYIICLNHVAMLRSLRGKKERKRIGTCTLLGCYAAYGGNSLPTFRDILSVPSSRIKRLGFLTLEDGTYRMSRNVGKKNHITLCNIPEERRSHVLRGWNPKSSKTDRIYLSSPSRTSYLRRANFATRHPEAISCFCTLEETAATVP